MIALSPTKSAMSRPGPYAGRPARSVDAGGANPGTALVPAIDPAAAARRTDRRRQPYEQVAEEAAASRTTPDRPRTLPLNALVPVAGIAPETLRAHAAASDAYRDADSLARPFYRLAYPCNLSI